MASYNKVNDFVLDLGLEIHDFDSDTLKVALSDTAPGDETDNPTADGNGELSNVTEIDYSNCSSRELTVSDWSVSSGTAKLTIDDLTLTASGGSVGPFRYVYIYNDSASNDELIAYFDYGNSVTLNDGDSFELDPSQSNGVLTIT
ncbi:MAG: hypothetical protein ACOCTT_01815 [archaeon]